MARNRRLGCVRDEFQFDDADEVLCHCLLRASRRISHTTANPGRKFFGCPRYVSQADPGCGFFVWYEVKMAALNEKEDLVRMVDFLRERVRVLETENQELRERLYRHTDVSSTDVKLTNEVEMLTERVRRLETRATSTKTT
ncbi:hypothetical protein LINPERHAP1_LOCUS30846 [Linum perenne]